MDFNAIISGLDVDGIVSGLIALAGSIAMIGFVEWGSKKLSKLYG